MEHPVVLQSDTIGTRKRSHLRRLKMECFCVPGTMTKCPRGGGFDDYCKELLPRHFSFELNLFR